MTAEIRSEFMVNAFLDRGDAKEGWTVRDIVNLDTRLVIRLLNLIFHLEKPKRVTANWASTSLGAMAGKIQVDWAIMMKEMVHRKIQDLRKVKKPCIPCRASWVTYTLVKGS